MTTSEWSHQPRSGEPSAQAAVSSAEDVDAAVSRAVAAFEVLRATSPGVRRDWLHAAARALEAAEEELVGLADAETALGADRLVGEVRRTAGQLRYYGDVAARGSYLGAAISRATGLCRVATPLGPVAVFGASNFPFAFGAVGNDTASALAAGCPVVVKAHPAHLGTGLRTIEVVADALRAAGAPDGTLAAVVGYEPGLALVDHPAVAAVAFTGSGAGGTSLWRRAHERAVPVPVYAEMGTVNAVVVLPDAAGRTDEIAAGFVGSYTAGDGQFCTKPGLLLAPRAAAMPQAVAGALARVSPQPVMLTRAIADGVRSGVAPLEAAGAQLVARHEHDGPGWSAPAALLTAPLSAIHRGSPLLEECFGPVALVVEYDDVADVLAVLPELPGALAGAVFAGPGDALAGAVVDALHRRVGRVVLDGWPTGVAVDDAQHHGGPWPATSDPRATSVGAAALERFVRPVAFQGLPDGLLPPALQDANPWGIERRVDGAVSPVER